jgi:tetratricopeptide (TPR) repeat protein
MAARFDDEVEEVERAIAAARELGRMHFQVALFPHGAAGRMFGSTPIPDVLAWMEAQEASGLRHPALVSLRAQALAYSGNFEAARSLAAKGRTELAERGAKLFLGLMTAHGSVDLELLAGDPAAGARLGEEGCRLLEDLGDRGWLSTACAKLGECYRLLGRLDDAQAQAARSAELGAEDDIANEQQWREVAAKVLAQRGERDESERLAREALALAGPGDLLARCFVLVSLAEVHELNGRIEEAVVVYGQALESSGRKGIVPVVARARERRDELLLQLQQ